MYFLLRNRKMFDAFGDNIEFTRIQDHVADMHPQDKPSLDDQEHFIRFGMLVPHEFSPEFYELHVLTI
jgi:hypothetical protein